MQIQLYLHSKGSALFGVARSIVKDSRDRPANGNAVVQSMVFLDSDGRVNANRTKPWNTVSKTPAMLKLRQV